MDSFLNFKKVKWSEFQAGSKSRSTKTEGIGSAYKKSASETLIWTVSFLCFPFCKIKKSSNCLWEEVFYQINEIRGKNTSHTNLNEHSHWQTKIYFMDLSLPWDGMPSGVMVSLPVGLRLSLPLLVLVILPLPGLFLIILKPKLWLQFELWQFSEQDNELQIKKISDWH